MKKNYFNNYIIEYIKSVEKQLEAYFKDFKAEKLHRMRVAIKKIKAILAFIEVCFDEKIKLKDLNLIFHQSGKIRELQINIELLSKSPNPPVRLINQLKKTEQILIQQLQHDASKLITALHHLQKKRSIHYSLPEKEIIEEYFEKKYELAIKHLNNNDRKDLHIARKEIKQLIYLYDILPSKHQKDIAIDIKHLGRLQTDIGNWHDHFAFLQFIDQYAVPKSFKPYLLKLKEDETIRFKKLIHSLKTD